MVVIGPTGLIDSWKHCAGGTGGQPPMAGPTRHSAGTQTPKVGTNSFTLANDCTVIHS